jgi:ABC-type nitrate/sulfonate/bicarbonate transport system substrate-binding protein
MTVLCVVAAASGLQAQESINVSYGGQNETTAPLWVGADKGFFKKYGLDVNVIQVRNGQVSLSALMSGSVHAFWPALSSVISGVSGGAKIGCIASPYNRIARELVVRKEIDSLAALRNKLFGVQSMGGGFWLQTVIVLEGLGVDVEKYGLQMRVIGDEPTILQALLAGNIDAAVITFASAEIAKRAGFRSLANSLDLKVAYQGAGLCTRSDRLTQSKELMEHLLKGVVDALTFIHEPQNKPAVMGVLKKHLLLRTDQDAETSYNSLRMVSSLDVAPNPAAWKSVQRFVSQVNPKVARVDINQIIDGSFVKALEDNGYLAELRKRLPR